MENQELRQATNKVELVGVVKEQKLNAGRSENGKYINGALVVKCGEFTEITLKVMVNELTSTGNVKKAYTTLKSILDGDNKTLADGVDFAEATKIKVFGNGDFTAKFKEEMYASKEAEGEVKTMVSIDLGFGNIVIDNSLKEEDFKATFDVEMFIEKVKEEIINDESTGRAIVTGWTPVYGGLVIPLTIVAGIVEDEEGEFDFGDEVLSQLEEGMTVNFWGDINYLKKVEKIKKGGSLGRAKTEDKTTYVHELVATGADVIPEEKEYDADMIKAALTERENKKQEALTKESKKEDKGKGLRGGARINKREMGNDSSQTSEDKPKRPRF